MTSSDFWTINANVQIATALILIVILLTYIAVKLSESKTPHRSSRAVSR